MKRVSCQGVLRQADQLFSNNELFLSSTNLQSFELDEALLLLVFVFVVFLRRFANERAEESSTSNWGTGEPPIDENQTQRGVTSDRSFSGGKEGGSKVGGHDESTSEAGAGEVKKSRTGGDMAEDGQVRTPHLQKMRTTRDMIQDKGKETEERLARSQPNSD